jgi:DNA-binding transcriptional MerR regulator
MDAAHLTGVHPEMISYYCRLGLLDDRPDPVTTRPTFDNDALVEISRIEHYRRYLGVHRRALPLICQLRRECERMRIKLAFLGDTWSEGAWRRDT